MADTSDYFCKPDTPDDLKKALMGGDQDRLRAWCKQNPDRLALALECIHPQHAVCRAIVERQQQAQQRAEDSASSERQHRETLGVARQANRISFWAIALAILALVISAIQLILQFRHG